MVDTMLLLKEPPQPPSPLAPTFETPEMKEKTPVTYPSRT